MPSFTEIIRKNLSTSYVPGVVGNPGKAAVPGRTVIEYVPALEISSGQISGTTGGTLSGDQLSQGFGATASIRYVPTSVYIPGTPAIPPTAGVAPSAAVQYNYGWNTVAASFESLPGDGTISFQCDTGTVAAQVAACSAYSGDPLYRDYAVGWYFSNGLAAPIIFGALQGSLTAFASTDVFDITRKNGSIIWNKNGSPVLTMGPGSTFGSLPISAVIAGGWQAVVCLYAGNDTIANLTFTTGDANAAMTMQYMSMYGTDNPVGLKKGQAAMTMQYMTVASKPYNKAAMTMQYMTTVGLQGIDGVAAMAMQYMKVATGDDSAAGSGAAAGTNQAYMVMLPMIPQFNHGYATWQGSAAMTMQYMGMHATDPTTILHGKSAMQMQTMVMYGEAIWPPDAYGYLDGAYAVTTMTPTFILVASLNPTTGIVTTTMVGIVGLTASMLTTAHVESTMTAIEALIQQMMTLVKVGENLKSTEEITDVWLINADTNATTRYENFTFNAMAKFRGAYYGTRDDGVYLLEGDDDAGEAIHAYLDFGIPTFRKDDDGHNIPAVIKRIPQVYIGASSSKEMYLKVVVPKQQGTPTQTFIYRARAALDELSNQRFDLGKGLHAVYYNFVLLNQDGDDFELDDITFRVLPLGRRI